MIHLECCKQHEDFMNERQNTSCLVCKELNTPCAEKLTMNQVKSLNRNRAEVLFKKGEVLCKQGAFASHIMYIREGLAKVYLENENKNFILKVKSPGYYLGLNSLFRGNVFTYSASAFIDTKVCMIDSDAFKNMILENAAFGAEIIKILNKSIMQTYDRLYNLTQKHLHGRLADIILCLAEHIYHDHNFQLEMTRKELGELSSMATESVIRILKEFKEEGIVILNGRSIEIHNPERLRQISELG